MRFAIATYRNSLGRKVLGAYLVGVLLSILLIGAGLGTLLLFRSEVLSKRVEWRAQKLAAQLEFNDAGAPVGLRPSEHGIDWTFDSFKDEMAYRVLDESGEVKLYSPAGASFWSASGHEITHPGRRNFEFEREAGLTHVAIEQVTHDGRVWFMQYGESVRVADLFQFLFALPFMGAGIAVFSSVLLVVFGACSYVTLRRTFKPLHDLSASAAAISPRSLNARLRVEGVPTEVAPLVESFNRALERLEHGYRTQQEFLAAAAHELKTPLALIRGQIELSPPSEDRDALLLDVGHMTRQVQQLLHLAEASEVGNYHLEAVDVAVVAHEAADYLKRMAHAAEVSVELQPSPTRLTWMADRGALFTLLKNLLENAIQHAPRGTQVSIETGVQSLTVRDWGPGTDEVQLSKMFDRFWRGDHRHDEGAGLGLAICREVAQAHGWILSAHRAEPGLRLVVSRPGPRPPKSP